MKFQIETKTLKNTLDIVNHATASISTTPILENILIKVNYNNIVLTSNNLEMAIEHIVTENLDIALEWAFCVPSKIFTNYISLLSDDIVHIELLNDNSIEVKLHEELILMPEPENEHDRYAIKIINSAGNSLGYLPRYHTEGVSQLIEKDTIITCRVIEVNRNDKCLECIKVELTIEKNKKL